MKTPSGIRTEIHNLLDLLSQSEIAILINPVVRKQSGLGISTITWANSNTEVPPSFHGNFGSIDEYCGWIHAQAYSAILYDGAIIQLSYDFISNILVAHRLLYYPCPFDIDQVLLKEEPILDVINLYRQQNSSYVRLRSPFRFDYDSEAQSPGHPASHLTVVSEQCRWAVVSPLSPGHFVRFIFQHFYHSLWSMFDFLREWPQQLDDRTITPDEESVLHINCTR